MSSPRACLNCRRAKVKCDLNRPSCSRCGRRGVSCTGYPVAGEYAFRDETANAQRLSERARRQTGNGRISFDAIQFELSGTTTGQQTEPLISDPDLDLQQQYQWLNKAAIAEIPEPLKRDVETRAVERFFVNWTVHPSEASPGHMHDLPKLYHDAPPESVLRLAIRSVAFADMQYARDEDGVPFNIKSQRNYGSALARMRAISNNERELADDRILAGLLVIDYYESLYLARDEPLGRHIDAVRYIVRARGTDQLHSHSRFCLWRVANLRLQARQILLGEEPDDAQKELMSKLNLERPELHISADVLHITRLCAAAKTLLASSAELLLQIEQAEELLRDIQELLTTIDSWTSAMSGIWKPTSYDARTFVGSMDQSDYPPDHPFRHFQCPRVLRYIDISLACIWNFYSACQIVLREAYIQVAIHSARLQGHEDQALIQRIAKEKDAIEKLSGSIIRSFPLLMGFAESSHPVPSPQGKMVGRFLGLFAMIVIQRAEHTSVEHKRTAGKVTDWILASHKLG